MISTPLVNYTLHLADNALILGHRNSEWTGHGPVLEQDIALSNIALDLIGQARNFYQYAADLIGNGTTEDSLAYLRSANDYRNLVIVEQENGDWGKTIMRQFLFSAYQYPLFDQMSNSKDARLAAIAAKSLKEVTYHLRWSSEWVIRLGQGTVESARRMKEAIARLWAYTPEIVSADSQQAYKEVDMPLLAAEWHQRVSKVLSEAGIQVPGAKDMAPYKEQCHTRHLEQLLAEMQYMQRTYPGMEW